MPRLSKKTMFAIEAVLDVAFHVGEHPVRSGDITERQRIPKRYLEQVLQQLVRCNVLRGVRGPRGGYRLARERRRVTLGEVIRVLEGGEEQPSDVPAGSGGVRCRAARRAVFGPRRALSGARRAPAGARAASPLGRASPP